jgi:hypothetical protein
MLTNQFKTGSTESELITKILNSDIIGKKSPFSSKQLWKVSEHVFNKSKYSMLLCSPSGADFSNPNYIFIIQNTDFEELEGGIYAFTDGKSNKTMFTESVTAKPIYKPHTADIAGIKLMTEEGDVSTTLEGELTNLLVYNNGLNKLQSAKNYQSHQLDL